MENAIFRIGFDEKIGRLTSLCLVGDPKQANFIKEGRGLFEPHAIATGTIRNGIWDTRERGYTLLRFEEKEECATIVWERGALQIEERFFFEEERLKIQITAKNTAVYPLYFKREDFAFYTPFADSYDSADVCTNVRCHTHIADFGQASYIRLERMGESRYHIGLVFTDADIQSYSQENVPNSNDRGFFVMNVEPFVLQGGEKKRLEAAVFAHDGGEDFFKKAAALSDFMRVECEEGFTLSLGQKRRIRVTAGKQIGFARAECDGKPLPMKIYGNVAEFSLRGKRHGETRAELWIDDKHTHADFFITYPLEKLLERRLRFIVEQQQCLDQNSPLYGAFLIYDNEEKAQYFSYEWRDHNVCRERFGMAILLAKYLRTHSNAAFRAALDRFTAFLLREAFDPETGAVFDTIGKDESNVRLYNAPWVALYFTELYELDKKEEYAEWVTKIVCRYYENGGTTFYPNGIRFIDFVQAVQKSGRIQDVEKMRAWFDVHIENLMNNGIQYPPHEVNFEQTIVTPAMMLMMDQYRLTSEEKYLKEAEKHLSLLRKFDGAQPDFHRNKIPIRYWDDFWFGKEQSRVYGDTFPHYWSSLSGMCYWTYGKLTNKKEWQEYGRQTIENCYCLYKENGEGSCAYVMPWRVNGKKGRFYDPFANDQDFALYFAMKITEDRE